MASPGFGLAPPTGANQYSDANYALPSMQTSARPGTSDSGFAMFAQPSPSGASPATPPGSPNTPGIVSPGATPVSTSNLPGTGQGLAGPNTYNPNDPAGSYGGVKNVGTGAATVNPLFPQFTEQFYNYLSSQLGKGATPFNQSTLLPSSGEATTPGSLNAPLNDVSQMLEQFYKTGSGGPVGTSTMESMAQTGNPTDVGPAWEAMIKAQQQNTDRNAANLREQFAFGGDLKSSPFGQSMQDFFNQNTLNQNAQLTAAEQQAQEAAAGRQATAAQDLTSGATGLGTQLQGLDQQAIQNMLAEFVRTRPEYAPLLAQQGGAATTFPPTISDTVGVGGLGGALASAGTGLDAVANLWKDNSSTATPAG
jgi:hypothetical protein